MQLDTRAFQSLSNLAKAAALKAGELISEKANSSVVVERKQGGDSEASQVVTEVDRQAQEVILEILGDTISRYDLGFLAEESEDNNSRLIKDYFWCIDPLDGTLPFIESTPGYSVSIALVSKSGEPQLGVIFDPVNQNLYHAKVGEGAFVNDQVLKISSDSSPETFSMFSDRSFLKAPKFEEIHHEMVQFSKLMGYDKFELISHGGGAMNAIWVLENAPSCYFKFPKPTDGGGSLWDYAASACIATEAGAKVCDMYGAQLDLNRQDSTFMNHRGVLYASDSRIANHIMEIFNKLK